MGILRLRRLKRLEKDFENVFQEKDDNVVYLSIDKVKTRITDSFPDKSISELLEAEYDILRNHRQQSISKHIIKALDNSKERLEVILDKLKEIEYGGCCYTEQ